MNQLEKCRVLVLPATTLVKGQIIRAINSNKVDFGKFETASKILENSFKIHGVYNWQPMDLHVINGNEKIVDGDIAYHTTYTDTLWKVVFKGRETYGIPLSDKYEDKEPYRLIGFLKVVASTDKSFNLPRPSSTFLGKYCEKKGKIDEIMVSYELSHHRRGKDIWKIVTAPDNTITIRPVKETYMRAEVRQLIWQTYTRDMEARSPKEMKVLIKEFEQFLNTIM